MLESPDVPDHLSAVDAEAWPGVATVPSIPFSRLRDRLAEARFASACGAAGIELDPENNADITVESDIVFRRIAASGWMGLAEGFLAGEWRTGSGETLVEVLMALIKAGYRPKTPSVGSAAADARGEVPPELIRYSSGDGLSAFAGHFATGVPTTQRVRVKSHVPRAPRDKAGYYYIDRTDYTPPLDTHREDLADAQRRSAEMLLDASGTKRGSHLLEFPSAGGAVAIAAAKRGATVDAWVMDESTEQALRDRLVYEGIGGAVYVEPWSGQQSQIKNRRGYYNAVVGMERIETLDKKTKGSYLKALSDLVSPGGTVAVQTVVRTDEFSSAASAAVQSLRAYVWPGLYFSTPGEIETMVDRHTHLRVTSESHAPGHLAASLALQHEIFNGQYREAAADGFDAVYRRLWRWQFALREALARLGMIELVHITMVSRDRRGKR